MRVRNLRWLVFLLLALSCLIDPLWAKSLICDRCGHGIKGEFLLVNGKRLCIRCFEGVHPVCPCCGQSIQGKYCTYFGGSFACLACADNKSMERCIECMCPVNPTRVKSIPQYGGYLCENHSDGAVVDEEMAQKLFLQMRKNVEKTLGSSMVVNSRRLSCKLVGKETLREESCVESEDIRGFCKSRKIWPFTWHTIFIRAGMSQEHTLAVMAHEMTHAWMFENNPNDAEATAIFNEGFCEWVSYRTAAAHDAKLEMKRMLNNVASDDYRNGLRKFLKYEKKHGMAGTIKLGKTGKSI